MAQDRSTQIMWIRTSRLSIKKSLSTVSVTSELPSYAHHARVSEGVAKRHFPLKEIVLNSKKACPDTLLNEFNPSNTLAWQGCVIGSTIVVEAGAQVRSSPDYRDHSRIRSHTALGTYGRAMPRSIGPL